MWVEKTELLWCDRSGVLTYPSVCAWLHTLGYEYERVDVCKDARCDWFGQSDRLPNEYDAITKMSKKPRVFSRRVALRMVSVGPVESFASLQPSNIMNVKDLCSIK